MENNKEKSFNRDEVLRNGSDLIKKLYLRLSADRFRPHENDNEYLKMLRGYTQLVQALSQIDKDSKVDELEQRIINLEDDSEV